MPSIPRVLHQGLAADKPTADATVNQGWMYYETDTDTLKQSWNGVWTTINAPAVSNTLVKLEDQVVGIGGAASITFATIDQTFAGLRIEVTGAATAGSSPSGFSWCPLMLEINGDTTAANYQALDTFDGVLGPSSVQTAVNEERTAPLMVGVLADPRTMIADVPGQTVLEIPDYAGTVFAKIGWTRHASSPANYDFITRVGGFLWKSTAAVTDLVFTPAFGDFVAGSRARLYGIL